MKNFFGYFKKRNGLYKIAFCICTVFLCVLTVVITNNTDYERLESDVAQVNDTISGDKFKTMADNGEEQAKEEVVHTLVPETKDKTELTENSDKSFSLPLNGEVIKEFSIDKLIYSKTMDDWRIHTGIDISGEIGNDILAAQSGIISYVGYDINMGYMVRIVNGEFECSYMSLSSEIPVYEGQNVVKGQVIGQISESGVQEFCDGGHLHFEIKKDGQIVNPSEYLYY